MWDKNIKDMTTANTQTVSPLGAYLLRKTLSVVEFDVENVTKDSCDVPDYSNVSWNDVTIDECSLVYDDQSVEWIGVTVGTDLIVALSSDTVGRPGLSARCVTTSSLFHFFYLFYLLYLP